MASSPAARAQQSEASSPSAPASSIPVSLHPKERSVPLQLSPHTTLHMQVTPLGTSTIVFLTTTDSSTSSTLSALGSLIYSMPNRFQSSEPLSTPIQTAASSIDFATRVAKILVRRTQKPAYVGCSAVFGNYGIEEEMAGVGAAVEGIMEILHEDED